MAAKIVTIVLTSVVALLVGWDLRSFVGPFGGVIRAFAWLSLIGGVVLLLTGAIELGTGAL